MSGLAGKIIAIAASRQADIISILISKNGGTPILYPIQGEQTLNETTCKQNFRELINQPFDIVMLTTGIGVQVLEDTAQSMNLHSDFLQKLKDTDLVVRGSKTIKWLKKHSLHPSLVSEDGTMDNLLASMASKQLNGRSRLFLQAYNQDDAMLQHCLEKLGYDVYVSKPYQFRQPDRKILLDLRRAVLHQEVDAVLFTSKTQVQHFFADNGNEELILRAFHDHVLPVAVGKVTANELYNKGISYVFQPKIEKMGALVVELKDHFGCQTRCHSRCQAPAQLRDNSE